MTWTATIVQCSKNINMPTEESQWAIAYFTRRHKVIHVSYVKCIL